MNPFLIRLLLAIGLLMPVVVAYAQSGAAKPSTQSQAPHLVLPQRIPLPPTVTALHYAQAPTGAAARSKGPLKPARPRPLQHASSKLAPMPKAATSSAPLAGPISEVWAARYNGFGDSYEVATDVVVDAAGNTYVAGYSLSVRSYDYAIVKYDGASGQQLWQARYSGPNNSLDLATAITLDAAGNVYVTGTSSGPASSYSYVTLKYSADGQQLWQATYRGLGLLTSRYNVATDIVVDAASNVYVTGYSTNNAGKYSYATVKYAGAGGQQLWAARYTGASNSDNLTTNLAVDAASNVYVTGTSYAGNQSDYVTVKYTAGGQQTWAATYNAPGNGYDLVSDVAVDAAGNVAVTGTSDNGSSYDYATVKYSATGQPLWETRYNGAGNGYDEATSLAMDATGNVLVTGYSNKGNSNWDYATIKYAASSGQQLWEARYNGPDEGYDEATELVVDATNNVLVTGLSYNNDGLSDQATVKYAGGSGQQLWAIRYNGPADNNDVPGGVAVDPAGNVYTTGSSVAGSNNNWDYATVKYAGASGQQSWQAAYNWADNSDDVAVDVAVDAAGNVYVVGSSQSSGSSNVDYVTIKYAANGQELWKTRYHNPLNSYGRPVKLVVDAAGNVYVTGSNAMEVGFGTDYLTLKYDGATGQQLWEARYGGTDRGSASAADMALDNAGNVYVTGGAFGVSSAEYATVKYDGATGQQLWEARYNALGSFYNGASRLVLDAAGNVYVSGIFNSNSRIVFATIKYNGTTGQQVWDARFPTFGTGTGATVDGLTVDAAGNVYITGKSDYIAFSSECLTIKYAANGQQLWVARYKGPDNGYGEGAAVAVDAAGDVYVMGRTISNNTGTQGFVVKYARTDGRQLWETRYGGVAGFTYPVDLALDAAGDVYITGATAYDFATLKYAAATGRQLWEVRYNGPGNGNDQAVALALDAAGNVYVTGSSAFFSNDNSGSDYATIKYSQINTTSSVPVMAAHQAALARAATAGSVQDLSVYPNPAVGQASVSFRPVSDGAAQVLVYNQLGWQVASLYSGAVRKGQRYTLTLDGQQLAPGLYTCLLLVDGQRETVRLVIEP
ncbi:SBBP repeat-containing protein [Hymenobacter sp. YC55]|uniref:SBBP repeat-containing protein n=1 Tax=Hymenobacter sp. YC55 TaxID=3034019 RepID=UPI0023F85350|nr:SBBP repeat-containing protein [Hymenobacter sp. YC55]MDF7815235.1 SBBP repeat-containing protein [Hymenobacter sp. YC55]